MFDALFNTNAMAALAELCKMGLQLLGALVVARLAVSWALGRYKAEKSWERETTALADLLSGIGDMRASIRAWLNELQSGSEMSEAWQEQQNGRYKVGREKLDGVIAVAEVVLPEEVATVLEELREKLDARYDTWIDDLLSSDDALAAARTKLVSFGRNRRR